jgi:hypothetical protein
MPDPARFSPLMRDGMLDAELVSLLWILLDARTPVIVVGRSEAARDEVVGALARLLPSSARTVDVAADDDFDWLPEAVELGWRRERGSGGHRERLIAPTDGVLVARGLAAADGVAGARARIVVRALALGYGLLATMTGAGLDDVLNALDDPSIGSDPDERSRLGVVLAVARDGGSQRVTAAHYIRPVAVDPHGHVRRQQPAVLATWNAATGRWDHFAWGVMPDLAGRLGVRPIELEREQVRRIALLLDAAAPGPPATDAPA